MGDVMKKCVDCGKRLVNERFIFSRSDGLLCESCGKDFPMMAAIPTGCVRGKELLDAD